MAPGQPRLRGRHMGHALRPALLADLPNNPKQANLQQHLGLTGGVGHLAFNADARAARAIVMISLSAAGMVRARRAVCSSPRRHPRRRDARLASADDMFLAAPNISPGQNVATRRQARPCWRARAGMGPRDPMALVIALAAFRAMGTSSPTPMRETFSQMQGVWLAGPRGERDPQTS